VLQRLDQVLGSTVTRSLPPLPSRHDQFAAFEVGFLDAQTQGFQQAIPVP